MTWKLRKSTPRVRFRNREDWSLPISWCRKWSVKERGLRVTNGYWCKYFFLYCYGWSTCKMTDLNVFLCSMNGFHYCLWALCKQTTSRGYSPANLFHPVEKNEDGCLWKTPVRHSLADKTWLKLPANGKFRYSHLGACDDGLKDCSSLVRVQKQLTQESHRPPHNQSLLGNFYSRPVSMKGKLQTFLQSQLASVQTERGKNLLFKTTTKQWSVCV